MKTDQILYYVLFLLVGGVAGYMAGSYSSKSAPTPPPPLTASNEKGTPEAAPVPVEGAPASTPETAPAPAATTTPAATTSPAATTPTTSATSTPSKTLPTASLCFSGDKELEDDLNLYASKIEDMKLIYDGALNQDCSGIFYRLIDEFAKKKCDGYQYPSPAAERPARLIAKWYYDHKNFTIVNDPMASRNMIKPGAVMFYGAPGKKTNNIAIEQLTGQGGIFHIGVVTSVTRDADGNIIQYTLFHGRSKGTTAGRTHYHNVRGPANLGQPILGVGSEEWVGIGYLFTPKG